MEPDNLSDFERRAWRLILETPPPGRHAARSAVFHVAKARAIAEIDPLMALFRGITGEEEAARAIFHALQRHQYTGAERLKWKDHRHKAAVVPFLSAVGALVKKQGFAEPRLVLNEDAGKDRLVLQMLFTLPSGQKLLLTPDPPLGFALYVDDRSHDFAPELADIATGASLSSIDRFVRNRANQRNHYLYASEKGVPGVTGDIAGQIEQNRGNVFSMLAVYLLIDNHAVHQPFVQQALAAFLKSMDLVPGDSE